MFLFFLRHVQMIDVLSISSESALRWIPHDFTDDKSTLVEVMAWCHQATSIMVPEPMLTHIYVARWRH